MAETVYFDTHWGVVRIPVTDQNNLSQKPDVEKASLQVFSKLVESAFQNKFHYSSTVHLKTNFFWNKPGNGGQRAQCQNNYTQTARVP